MSGPKRTCRKTQSMSLLGVSGHALLHRTCPLLTQSGHWTRVCGSWHAFGLHQAALGSNVGAGWAGAMRWPRKIHLRNSSACRRTISSKRHRAASAFCRLPTTANVPCSTSSPMPREPWQSHASMVSGTGRIQFAAAGTRASII